MNQHRDPPDGDRAHSTAPTGDASSASPARDGGGPTTRSLPARPGRALPPSADDATTARMAAKSRAAAVIHRRNDRANFSWGEPEPGDAEDDSEVLDGDAAGEAHENDDEPAAAGDPVTDALMREAGEPLVDAASYSDDIGADVAGARVVTGPGAESAAAAVDARAFTVGDRVFMGAGESPTDRALMGHELTHVAQQQDAAAPVDLSALAVTSPTDAREHEADGAAAPTPGPLEIARTPRGVRTGATRNMGARVKALEDRSDSELRALKADLTARLSGTLGRQERRDLAHERDAIEWAEYQHQLERGESGRAGSHTRELDAAQAAGRRHGVGATSIGARAQLEGAYRTGGDHGALTTKAALGMRGGNLEQRLALEGQHAAIGAEATTFKAEFREQARHTAMGMLDQSSVEIEAALAQHGFVGGKHRLFDAADGYNRDPGKLDQLIADWRGLSDGRERATEKRKGDQEQANLALLVKELRKLQAEADRLERDEKNFTEADWAHRDAIEGARTSTSVRALLADAWVAAEIEHPILMAFRHEKHGADADRLGGMTSQGAGMEQSILRQAIPKLGNILRTRAAIRTDQLDPLRMGPVVELTKQQMHVPPGSVRAAAAKELYEAANQGSLADSVLSALSIALSVVSFVPGVGLGAKAAAEAVSLAIELRAQVNEYKEWKVAGVASNTALDMARSVSTYAPELRPLWLRLAVGGASAASLKQLLALRAKLTAARAAASAADDVLRELDELGAKHGVKGLGDEVDNAGGQAARAEPRPTTDGQGAHPAGPPPKQIELGGPPPKQLGEGTGPAGTVESTGNAFPSAGTFAPHDEAPIRALMERHYPHNKKHRIGKSIAALKTSPYGADLSRMLQDPRLQACEGFDDAVGRLLPATVADHEGLLAELLEAQRMLDTPANRGKKLALGRKSLGTRRGGPGHFDADVAVLDAQGNMELATQVYRPRTTDLDKALDEGLEKGREQLTDAPASSRRVVIYLREGSIQDVNKRAERLSGRVKKFGIEVEVVAADGRRVLYTPATEAS